VPPGETGSKAKTAENSIRDIPDVQAGHSYGNRMKHARLLSDDNR
jgi:hypothetical protein